MQAFAQPVAKSDVNRFGSPLRTLATTTVLLLIVFVALAVYGDVNGEERPNATAEPIRIRIDSLKVMPDVHGVLFKGNLIVENRTARRVVLGNNPLRGHVQVTVTDYSIGKTYVQNMNHIYSISLSWFQQCDLAPREVRCEDFAVPIDGPFAWFGTPYSFDCRLSADSGVTATSHDRVWLLSLK